jgi:hypothetical protein
MSLSNLQTAENALEAPDRLKETEIRPGSVKAWQAGSNRAATQADSPVETTSGWNPAEVWRQRIKRDTAR